MVFQSLAAAKRKVLRPKTVRALGIESLMSLLDLKLRAEWERCRREER